MLTTQRQVRAAFWQDHPNLPRRKIMNYAGTAKNMHCTDTRCAFADYVDYLSKAGQISQALAQRVTL